MASLHAEVVPGGSTEISGGGVHPDARGLLGLQADDNGREGRGEGVAEYGEDKDYVKVCDLFTQFGSDNRTFQADRKTKKSAKMFERELHRCLKTATFKDKYSYRTQGRLYSVGKVLLGFKTRV